jgi:hypothetical protein
MEMGSDSINILTLTETTILNQVGQQNGDSLAS